MISTELNFKPLHKEIKYISLKHFEATNQFLRKNDTPFLA